MQIYAAKPSDGCYANHAFKRLRNQLINRARALVSQQEAKIPAQESAARSLVGAAQAAKLQAASQNIRQASVSTAAVDSSLTRNDMKTDHIKN